jgi:hypothetical protein
MTGQLPKNLVDVTEEEIRSDHESKIRWVIAFSTVNLDRLRPGEWITLKEDLFDFLNVSGQIFPGSRKRTTPRQHRYKISLRELRDIQKDLVFLLDALASGKPSDYTMRVKKTVFFFGCSSLKSPFIWDCAVQGKLDAVWIAFGAHLVGSRITQERILRCPECQGVFLSSRKPRADRQLHCSIRCSRNAATRRYREKSGPAIQAKDRTRGKRRYAAKVLGKGRGPVL